MTDTENTFYEPRDRGLRVSDPERESVAAILRRAHIDGRLDSVEFDDRLSRCLAAKSYAELDELIVDLPSENRTPVVNHTPRRSARVLGRRFPMVAVIPIVIALLVLSHGHLMWIAFPLFFLFVLRRLIWRRQFRFWWSQGRQYRRRAYGDGGL